MRNDLELYIGGELVDLSDSTKVLFNYKQKELTNPTIIKNSFTKTIELEKTDTNNKIFGHIWNLNRTQTDGTFNPSKRVDFVLMLNGELIESGYCKLDKIKDKYSVTLYGGLGDFFYNLMYDSATGEKKNLASLDYGYDLDFTINKDTLRTAWAILLNPTSDIDNKWKVINFAPCYNGISDQLDCDKVLINTSGITAGMRKWEENRWVDINGFPTTAQDNEYNLVNGYGFAELPTELNEWQVRDIRSYLQRPVISLMSIISACTNPVNNGGYEVELDDTFFTVENPYWRYGWITLPMLNDLGGEITEGDFSASVGNTSTFNGWYNTTYSLNTSTLPNADSFELSLKFRVTGTTDLGNTAYTSALIQDTGKKNYGGYAIHIIGCDASNNVVSDGDTVWLTSYLSNEQDYLHFSDTNIVLNGGNVYTHIGNFNKVSNGVYEWPEELTLKVETNSTRISSIKIQLYALANVEYVNDNTGIYSYGDRRGRLYNSRTITESTYYINSDYFKFDRNQTLTNMSGKYYTSESTAINSNSKITKNVLLSTDETPADYLISYCKLFNLYFEKDLFNKKIYIKTQRDYYDGEAIDIDELIDRDKAIEINPISFETKWYDLNYKSDDEGECEQKYKDNYGTQFGKQKINTGYDFNAQAKDLLESPFVNGVQVLESSKYYAVGETDFWNEIPTFLFNNVTYKLFNGDGDSTEITLSQPRNVVYGLINKNSDNGIRYDAFPKVQFHNGNDAIDGKNVLLFFNGFQNITSSEHYQPKYMLTDDLTEMFTVNDNNPCWLYTKSEFDKNGNRIAWEEKALPQFSRYTTVEKTDDVYYSWDFGRTKQFYVPAYNYTSADSTIYERYWKKYLTDLYDVDTRIVDCYVKFDSKVMPDYLKHFYYFDNSYWVISEIIDYNPASYETVKVRFVKVNDLLAYTDYSPAITPDGVIVITLYNPNVDATGGTVNGYVYVADGGAWTFSNWSNGLTPSITGGTGSTYFTLTVAANNLNTVRELTITANRNGYTNDASVIQEGNYNGFIVSPSALTFFNEGGVLQLTITNPQNHNWRIVGYPNWVTFPILTGTSSAIINVTAKENTTGINRTGTTVVYDYVDNKTYIINMEQVENQGDSEFLTVTQFAQYSHTNVPQTGGTCLYTVRSSSPWTVTCDRVYCIPQQTSGPSGSTTIEVVWPVNTSYSFRNAIMTFTNTEGYEVKVYKNQDGINLTNMYFDATGETDTIGYDADADVVTKADWVEVTTDGNGIYNITAEENTTGGERVGEVVLDNGNGGTLTIVVTQAAGEGSGGSCCEMLNSFRVEPNALYYDDNGGTQYFFIQNPNGDNWILTGYSWGTPNITYGRTSAIIAFQVSNNLTLSVRTQYITVQNTTNPEDTKQVYVEQTKGTIKNFSVSPTAITANVTGGTYQVTLTCTNYLGSDVISESHTEGITVGSINMTGSPTGSCVVDITVPANQSNTSKTYTVTFTLNNNKTATVTINQAAAEIYLTVNPVLINSNESGDTYSVQIYTNDEAGWRII